MTYKKYYKLKTKQFGEVKARYQINTTKNFEGDRFYYKGKKLPKLSYKIFDDGEWLAHKKWN